jgi:hypothetical protein
MSSLRFVEVGALGVFRGMVRCLEVGRRIGLRWRPPEAEGAATGVRVVEGAVFGLLGLRVAFTFAGAATRFDSRRQFIVEEINAIRRAYVRLNLLPSASRGAQAHDGTTRVRAMSRSVECVNTG